ncbi:MAG: chemotaxis protein CheD [Candidatus Anammoxibacter sp.]
MPGYKPKQSACCKLCLGECSERNVVIENDIITIGIGGCRVANALCVLRTTLGSCVGVTLYDKLTKTGGMIHIMLPDSSRSKGRLTRFADTGIPNLVNCMINTHSSSRSSLIAKMFGGAKMFNVFSKELDIGNNNVEACVNALKLQGVKVEGGVTGGTKGTQIKFCVSDGKVIFKTIGGKEEVY